MIVTRIQHSQAPARGLSGLAGVELSAANAALLKSAEAFVSGSAAWRHRKLAEAHDLLALSQIAPRLRVEYLDLSEALRVVVELTTPVPCEPAPNGELNVVASALLGITWPIEVLSRPLPGYSFVQILRPAAVWTASRGVFPSRAGSGWSGQSP